MQRVKCSIYGKHAIANMQYTLLSEKFSEKFRGFKKRTLSHKPWLTGVMLYPLCERPEKTPLKLPAPTKGQDKRTIEDNIHQTSWMRSRCWELSARSASSLVSHVGCFVFVVPLWTNKKTYQLNKEKKAISLRIHTCLQQGDIYVSDMALMVRWRTDLLPGFVTSWAGSFLRHWSYNIVAKVTPNRHLHCCR